MLEAQKKLAEIINDTPHFVNLDGTDYAVTRLKNGTQYLICEEAVNIAMKENAAFGDVMMCFASNMPHVINALALALLNDRHRIFKDGERKNGYSDEFKATCDTLMWDVSNESIVSLLMEVFSMLDINFFLTSSELIKTMKETMTKRSNQQK